MFQVLRKKKLLKEVDSSNPIILISKEYPPELGGAGTIASNIRRCLKSDGRKVVLITSRSKIWFLEMSIKVLFYSLKYTNSTIIINDVGGTYVCGLVLGKKRLQSSILWLHGSEQDKAFRNNSIVKKLMHFASINLNVFSLVRYRVYVSDYLRGKFTRISVTNGESVVIRNSINFDICELDNTIKSNDRNVFKLLTVSRVVSKKGFKRTLRAFACLPENFYWTIVGDGPYLKELEREVKEYSLLDRVNFTGRKTQNELIDFYGSHDAFVLLSDFEESFGLVYLEALYFGIPVLANNLGALSETLDSFTGVHFVEPEDTDETVSDAMASLTQTNCNMLSNRNIILTKFGDESFLVNIKGIIDVCEK
ncbi:glycosyltransferase family 4 protein [Vibrio maritimus]|uniref:glycosyltransferase family 4 protein n=1 Tax=Vibrio maritimus TaxID=990268 RepID=UPI00406828F6